MPVQLNWADLRVERTDLVYWEERDLGWTETIPQRKRENSYGIELRSLKVPGKRCVGISCAAYGRKEGSRECLSWLVRSSKGKRIEPVISEAVEAANSLTEKGVKILWVSRSYLLSEQLWLCPRQGQCPIHIIRDKIASAQSDQSLRCPHEETLGP